MYCSILTILLGLTGTTSIEKPPSTAPSSVVQSVDYPAPNPADPVNYIDWLNDNCSRGIEPNAADVYLEAFELMKPFEGDWGGAHHSPWRNKPELEQWLKANREALNRFRQAVRIDECYFPVSRPQKEPNGMPVHPRVREMLASTLLPHIQPHRTAVRAILAQGFREAARGDFRPLEDDAFIALRAARHLDRDPVLLRRLTGLGEAHASYEALFTVLAKSPEPATAKRILSTLQRVDPEHPSLRATIVTERINLLDFLQRLFKPLPGDDQWTLVLPVAEGLMLPTDTWLGRARILACGYQPTVDGANRYFDKLDAWYSQPDARVVPLDLRDTYVNDKQNILLTTLLPSLERARTIRMSTETTRRALHLTATLLSRDQLPTTLPASYEPLPKRLQIEPVTGKPFRYEQTNDGFRLYSLGLDRKDQGGQHEPDSLMMWDEPSDHLFWPRP
jgi:hypothetical protein